MIVVVRSLYYIVGATICQCNAHVKILILLCHRVKDKYKLQQTFAVDPVYLRHENSNEATDFMVHPDALSDLSILLFVHCSTHTIHLFCVLFFSTGRFP